MTAPTNTITSVTPNVGMREDLENVIYRVAPEETPFTTAIGTVKATNINHEWQTETLAAPNAANAKLEGDDVSTLDAANLTTRVGNYCQILEKSGGVSRTQQKVDLAGRADELDRQKILKGKEIKRDFEMRAIGNYASNAESGATTRKLGGALAWLTSNVSRGAGGSSGGFSAGVVAAATNGTQRTPTESLVKGALATGFSNGARPTLGFMGGVDKQAFSTFTGIADIRVDAKAGKQATIIGAADVYTGDFSNITLIPHPYALTRDMLFIDPDFWAVATLDGISTVPLAKTGDSDKFMMTMEKSLVSRNEKGSVVVADLL
jgi:hypothetical protein